MSAPTQPIVVEGPALLDTGVWSWVRDRRHPHLAGWFAELLAADRVVLSPIVALELLRAAANETRYDHLAATLDLLPVVDVPADAWSRARTLQRALASTGTHRAVPLADLLLAVCAAQAGVPLVHYDRDYERIATVLELDHRWFVPDGSLA